MTTSTLPQNWVAPGSETIVASVSANGATFTQPVTMTGGVALTGAIIVSGMTTLSTTNFINAAVTSLSSTQEAALFAGTNQAAFGTIQLVQLTINGTVMHVPVFIGGTLLPSVP